ncbi:ATP-dependent DNA ligase [Candidatus Woesearchaeota archaeon]|nr:ATP-dependent DNA ligase [Candidatus Woesearchaeota archaeon]MBW3005487.1 ATP-dependent DNA ligase [Candidatus Woesearchaeota archaeon]
MQFSKLADVFAKLEKISSGNKMREILSGFFKTVPKSEICMAAYMTTGRIASEYEDVVIGMADKMVLKSIALASGSEDVNKVFKQKGDVGLAAAELCGRKRKSLSVKEVYDNLHKIAEVSGAGSQERKIRILAELFKSASALEAKYIARLVLGTLRLGASDQTLLDSLSIAFTGTKKNKPKVEHAYHICPDVCLIAETVAAKGLKGLDKINVKVGVPIQMMLAQRVKSIQEILDKIKGDMAVEEKYDGERMQVHIKGKKIKIYSRRMDDITSQFPDVVAEIKKCVKCKSCIIEGECCAVDKNGKLLPFQTLMQRRRKYDIEKYIKKIPVCLFLFDLLYLDGKSYVQKDYPERHKALRKAIKKKTKGLKLANRIVTNDLKEIQKFFDKMVKHGAEGIMVKSCGKGSVYKAGTRGWLWIKWKKEYMKGMADTFDLVVVGAFKGRGRRAGSYGSLLCAVYNKTKNSYDTFTKLGSGFTDEQLDNLPKKFKRYELKKKHPLVHAKKAMKPDIWFTPAVVVEVLGAEITKSPIHTADGLALRFPRFLRYRPEKNPEQATTVKEIRQMYKK